MEEENWEFFVKIGNKIYYRIFVYVYKYFKNELEKVIEKVKNFFLVGYILFYLGMFLDNCVWFLWWFLGS